MTTPTDMAQALPDFAALTKMLGMPDATFEAWRDATADKHWKHFDLSALRIGYELGKAAHESRAQPASALHILFDGPPGPTAGRFVEVEDDTGKSINAGEWKRRDDGYWELVIPRPAQPAPQRERGGRMKAFGKSFLHAIRVAILIVLIVCLSPLIVAALALNAIGMLWETTW